MSWPNNSPEPVSDRHSSRPINQEILEFSLRERIDGNAKEEKNKNSLEKKHALEYRTGEPEILTQRKNDNEKTTVLPLPRLPQETKKTCISHVTLCVVIRKRRIEKEVGDIPITLNFKKPRGRTKQPKGLTGYISAVESLGVVKYDRAFRPSPSDFQASSQ